jgi:acetyl-CoA carboxylase carboxyl transferase subunit beta
MTTTAVTGAAEDVQWAKCPGCANLTYLKRLARNLRVCPECRHHLRLGAEERLEMLLDAGSFTAFDDDDLVGRDLLRFVDRKPYPQRLSAAQRKLGRTDAVLAGVGRVDGQHLVVAVIDFGFLGGSMGSVVGESIARSARHALAERLPLLIISASGGARMQEGAVSLMQMAKTAQWVARLREAGLACINLNTDPTFGGVTASFAMLGDVIIAEPGALIGFAGPQVIRNTIRQDLPTGFQTAEFLQQKGMVDLVVPREAQRATIGRLLRLLGPSMPDLPDGGSGQPVVTDAGRLRPRPPRETVTLARHIGRPTALDYLGYLFDDYLVLSGDRTFGDDPALLAGIGRMGGQSMVFLGHQKGHTTAELVAANFGMPNPEGYRKAQRLMRLAERFGLPVVALIDTPGAFPGIGAEERGQAVAIAECILELSRIPVPVVSVVTGEGGSGGALALGVANSVLIMENAYYSVISPEGCSTILFGSAEQATQAAESLRLRAVDLLRLGVVDGVVPESPGGAHDDPFGSAANLRRAVIDVLTPLLKVSGEALVDARRERFERFGHPRLQPTVDWED